MVLGIGGYRRFLKGKGGGFLHLRLAVPGCRVFELECFVLFIIWNAMDTNGYVEDIQ
jgi:hypothetical protein